MRDLRSWVMIYPLIVVSAATGGAAAVPAVGAAAASTMTVGATSWFMTAAAGYVLSALRVHGIQVNDLEHQKAIVLSVLAGGGGSTFFGKAAGRIGPTWASC